MMSQTNSTPTYTQFNPRVIPWQYRVIYDVKKKFNYDSGAHTVLLSGSVGSAKTTLLAHLIVDHCIRYDGATVCVLRKNLTDLKDTIWTKLIEHLQDLELGVDYQPYYTNPPYITFKNGSRIISRSWSDKQFTKYRSLELSMVAIEEFTEMQEDERQAYDEIKQRLGRQPHVPVNLLIGATNPDGPSHWLHEELIESKDPYKHVYYSRTEDNPFLPTWYITQLKRDLSPKMAERMLEGKWVEISTDNIYYEYQSELNFKDEVYSVDPRHPVWVSWDFNIGEGKPLSACLFQYIDDHFHFFDQIVVHGMRTLDSCEELDAKGYFDHRYRFLIAGDATGAARTTKALHSDWDIIKSFFANHPKAPRFKMRVPRSNPPIVNRHNKVNGYCMNALGESRLTVYRDCPMLDKGFRLTQTKRGSRFQEDDSKEFQHITTAAGYGMVAATQGANLSRIGNM